MLINTRDYGSVEIDEGDIITFKRGLYGFEQVNKYVVLGRDGEGIMQLQSAQDPDPRFVILDPFIFIRDYNPELPQEIYAALEAGGREELCVFVIAVIPENFRDIAVNLKSPVVINFGKKTGVQVILDGDYPVRHRVLDCGGGEACL